MIKKNWKKQLLKLVIKEGPIDTVHDFYHLIRVKNYAIYIGKKEKADLDVLFAAALLHDFFRDGLHHIKKARKFAKKILPKIGFPKEKMNKVDEAIGLHEQMHWQKKSFISIKFKETLIIQDADRLDTLGAIGLARVFAFAGSRKIRLFDKRIEPEYSPKYEKKERDEIYHIENNILKRRFNTAIGNKLAKEKEDFMQTFIKKFKEEFSQNNLK